MKLMLLSTLLFLSTAIHCTKKSAATNYLEYYHHINQAKYQAFKGNFENADSLFSRAFQLAPKPFFADCLRAAKNGLTISDEKVFGYLDKGMEVGLTLNEISNHPEFEAFQKTIYWNTLEEQYPDRQIKYEAQLNKALIDTLEAMVKKDQLVRTNPEKINQTMEAVDQKNYTDLRHLINQSGYPGISRVGEATGEKFPILFHHFHPADNEAAFYVILNEAVLKGELSPARYAAIRDYDCIKKGEKTIYGTYHVEVDGKKMMQPVKDFEKINERRLAIGLDSIEHFMEMEKIEYDPDFRGI